MPVRNGTLEPPTLAVYQQLSYESLVTSWLINGGWEVFHPVVDHDAKTDILAADKCNHYRIQIKTLASAHETIRVENKWKNAKIDYVIYFSRSSDWGYIVPAFEQNRKRLNDPSHIKFSHSSTSFLEAFEKI